jgi:hypothetical protein
MDPFSDLTALSPHEKDHQNDSSSLALSAQGTILDFGCVEEKTTPKQFGQKTTSDVSFTAQKSSNLKLRLGIDEKRSISVNGHVPLTMSQLTQSQSQSHHDFLYGTNTQEQIEEESLVHPTSNDISITLAEDDTAELTNEKEQEDQHASLTMDALKQHNAQNDHGIEEVDEAIEITRKQSIDSYAETASFGELGDDERKLLSQEVSHPASLGAAHHDDDAQDEADPIGETEDSEEIMSLMSIAKRMSEARKNIVTSVRSSLSQSSTNSATINKPIQTLEAMDNESDSDVPTTQVSKDRSHHVVTVKAKEIEGSPSPPHRIALKKREKSNTFTCAAQKNTSTYEFHDSSSPMIPLDRETTPTSTSGTTTNSKPKLAIRNLQFSFEFPDSEDSQSQPQNAPDLELMVSKTLEAVQEVTTNRIKSPSPSSQVNSPSLCLPSIAPVISRSTSPVKETRKTPMKTPKQTKRTRARTPTSITDRRLIDATPKRPRRAASATNTPSSSRHRQVTSSSTPSVSVRTRSGLFSPTPAYGTGSGYTRRCNLFKGKYAFCMTGFKDGGDESLKELIESMGGHLIGEEILVYFCEHNGHNSAAENHSPTRPSSRKSKYPPRDQVLVIATPDAFRRKKFMLAIACGIPVLHAEWLHACLKAQAIIPKDGYQVPSGFSLTNKRFELVSNIVDNIFTGKSYGIPFNGSKGIEEAKRMAELIRLQLVACGAQTVVIDYKVPSTNGRHNTPSSKNAPTVDYLIADKMNTVSLLIPVVVLRANK